MTIKRLPVGVSILAISLMLARAALAQTTGASDIVLRGAEAITVQGGWVVATAAAASGGRAIWLRDAGVPKIPAPSANPTHSFDLAFTAKGHTAYRLWIRGRAQSDFWGNDSVFIQFSGSVTSTGTAAYRIGTTSATAVNLED